jgi:hypothetical protein
MHVLKKFARDKSRNENCFDQHHEAHSAPPHSENIFLRFTSKMPIHISTLQASYPVVKRGPLFLGVVYKSWKRVASSLEHTFSEATTDESRVVKGMAGLIAITASYISRWLTPNWMRSNHSPMHQPFFSTFCKTFQLGEARSSWKISARLSSVHQHVLAREPEEKTNSKSPSSSRLCLSEHALAPGKHQNRDKKMKGALYIKAGEFFSSP